MKKNLIKGVLVAFLVILPFSVATAQKAKTTELKAVTWGKLESSDVYYFKRIMEEVNKRSNGELVIKYLGGPEVFSAKEQGNAVSSGLVDMVSIPLSRILATIPEADALSISPFSWAEERKNGWETYFRNILGERMNIYGLKMSINKYSPFMLFINKKISKPQELAGLKVRASSTYISFLKGLGAVPVDMPPSEMYSAVEKGLVDGVAYNAPACVRFQLFDVIKYYIDHPFWSGVVSTLMNKDKWNSLPKHSKELLTDITIKLEPEIEKYLKDEQERSIAKMKEKGMRPIIFSAPDAKHFIDLSKEVQLKILKKNCKPEQYKKIVSLLNQ
jgi:TRAP-type C4-dicarboxylate transport system substrate-binding protein